MWVSPYSSWMPSCSVRNLIYFEMGLIGLAAFLAIFVVLFAQLYRGCTHDRAGAIVLAILCIGYLTVSYADNLLDYLNFEWFFWFVLGTVMAWISPLDGGANRSRRQGRRH